MSSVVVAVVAVILGSQSLSGPGSAPNEGSVVNRVVEGPYGEMTRSGPVSLLTPPTTQPPVSGFGAQPTG